MIGRRLLRPISGPCRKAAIGLTPHGQRQSGHSVDEVRADAAGIGSAARCADQPGAFLRREAEAILHRQQIKLAIATTPAEAGVTPQVIDKIANSVIKFETGR